MLFMHLELSKWDHKRQFYFDVIRGKPFTFTSASSQTLIKNEMLLIFPRGGGQLWISEDYWTQMGMLTVQSASTTDFNWSASNVSVSV